MTRFFRAIWSWVIITIGFVRRELVDLGGQPRLLFILVLGPFAILLMFGGGYKNETISLRTTFVVPENSGIRETIQDNAERLSAYVVPAGFTTDLVEARRQLVDQEVDLVVVFPPDAVETVRSGQSAEIAVLHNKLDPIQQAAVDIAARVAVQEINAEVLTQIVLLGQNEVADTEPTLDRLSRLSTELSAASGAGSPEQVDQAASNLEAGLNATSLAAGISSGLIGAVDSTAATESEREQIAGLQNDLAAISSMSRTLRSDPAAEDAPEQARAIDQALQDLADPLAEFIAIPADVIVRPFSHDAESIVGQQVTPVDFFVPSALVLLVQHAAMTFAALTIVRDRDLGFSELYRVGSTPVSAILTGKALAFLLVGGAMAALLVVVVKRGLGVGVAGLVGSLAAVFALLLISSITSGYVLSGLARTDTQAVQYAMLFLLTSLFFGGFFLDLDSLRYPFKAISWALPITYAIRALQDVMLRGQPPADQDLMGLGAVTAVAAFLAWVLMRRETRAQ